MKLQTIDAVFEDLYRRLGTRYLSVVPRAALTLGFLAVVTVDPILLTVYFDVAADDILRTMAVHLGLVVATYLPFRSIFLRAVRPIRIWLEDRGNRGKALGAWRCAVSLSGTMLRLFAILGPPAIVLIVTYLALALPAFRSPLAISLAAVAGLATVAWSGAVTLLLTELHLRPIRADAARESDALSSITETAGLSMSMKLLLFASTISLLTGLSVAFAATFPAGSLDDLARFVLISVIVTLVTSVPLVLLLARVLLGSVDDLTSVTKKIGSGEFSARADVVTNDEMGALAVSFNVMLGTLEQASEEIRASRARIVAASDAERRRVERNIHDGAQQKLVALALQLRMLQDRATDPDVRAEAERAIVNLQDALGDLRELARGLHPSVLSTDGLRPALEQLADTASVPVAIEGPTERFPEAVESTAYFVASEALANVTKHAQATSARITVAHHDGRVILEVSDDGRGGASVGAGSGLTGLADRVEAVGGFFVVESRSRGGTTVRVELPTV